MFRSLFIALFLSFPVVSNTFAVEKPSVGECDGPDTSTAFESCTLSKQTAELDLKLNKIYKKLLDDAAAKVPSAKQALVEAQRAWIVYRDKTCAFQQYFLGGINSINAVRCDNALTAERLKYFEDL
ncbi:MAG TPA: lysozyme inhibitor LprI family protein [Usitatibacteraceae bacterium]